jgi:hypothetical protein
MDLTKYNTPISEDSIVEIEGEDSCSGIYLTVGGCPYYGDVVPLDVAQKLERKLKAATEFIERIPLARWQYIESGDMAVDAIELLKEIQRTKH